MGSSTPLTARVTLGAALRRYRDSVHGLKLKEVAERLDVDESQLSRVETGKRPCPDSLFSTLMDLYEVPDAEREELRELAAESKDRRPPWWSPYREFVSASYERYLGFEDAAVSALECQVGIVPGLLQTEDYARAVTSVGFASLSPDQIDGLVEVRMLRQRHKLEGPAPLKARYVITQAALEFRVGGKDAHRDQLRHLRELSQQSTIDLRAIPYERGEEGAQIGPYTIFQFPSPDMPDVAFSESVAGSVILDDPRDLRRLHRLHSNLTAAALDPQATRDLITMILDKET
jgi:transcriptional regulator with XRE-family HTH domain